LTIADRLIPSESSSKEGKKKDKHLAQSKTF
jgi:hypothetical protein